MHACMPSHTHTGTHAYAQTHTHTRTHTHIHTHTRTHAHTRTRTHGQIDTCVDVSCCQHRKCLRLRVACSYDMGMHTCMQGRMNVHRNALIVLFTYACRQAREGEKDAVLLVMHTCDSSCVSLLLCLFNPSPVTPLPGADANDRQAPCATSDLPCRTKRIFAFDIF